MPVRAQSADGAIHEFPDGTPDAVVDKAMRQYAVQKPVDSDTAGIPEAPAGEPQQSGWDKFATGITRLPQLVGIGGDAGEAIGKFAKGAVGAEYAASRGALRSVTGNLGERAIGAIASATTRQGEDPTALAEEANADREALRTEHPLSYGVGQATGGAATARALGGVGVKGAAMQGAVAGTIAGANERGNLEHVVEDAGLGAAGGKLAEGVVKLGGKLISTTPLAQVPKAVRALADRLGIKPQELVALRAQKMLDTGRKDVSWAEAADPKTREHYRGLAMARNEVAEVAGDARDTADALRPGRLADIAEGQGRLGTKEAVDAAKTEQFNAMMAKHGNTPVTINNPGDFDRAAVNRGLYNLSRNSPPAVRKALDNFRQGIGTSSKTPVAIRLRDVENVRQAVADAVERDPALKEVLGPVRDELRKLAEDQVGAYGTAMRTQGRLGDFGTGVEQGAAAASPSASTQALKERKLLQYPDAQAKGTAVGFRTRLVDDMKNSAGKTPDAYQGVGFQERIDKALGTAESDRIRTGFGAETSAARNLDRLDVGPRDASKGLGSVLVKGAVATSGRMSGGGFSDLALKAGGHLRSLGLSSRAAKDLATSFFSNDPVQNNIAARQLQKLGIIKDATNKAAAAAAILGGQAPGLAAE